MPGRDAASAVIEEIKKSYNETNCRKPVITCWLGEAAAKEPRELFAEPISRHSPTTSEAVTGFMQLVRYARAQAELMQTPPVAAGEADVRHRGTRIAKSFGYCQCRPNGGVGA